MPTFTLFDARGETIQDAKSMIDLLADSHVQGSDLDLAACTVLIEDGKQRRVLSLSKAIDDYVDPAQRAERVTLMKGRAAKLDAVATWLDALPVPELPAVEPITDDSITEPEVVTEATPATVKLTTRRRTSTVI